MSRAPAHQVNGTESGRKLLSVLMCFSGARPTWTVAELAAELQLSQSSAYRYVGLLRETGLLDASPGSSYRVTDRALALAAAAEHGRSQLLEVAMPVMTALRDQVGETVLLARRAGEFVFCVDRVESRRPVRLQFDRGQAMVLHAGSIPRLLLAYMPDAERRRYLDSVRPTLSPERAALVTDDALAKIARDGHCESMEEIDEGIWGTAAAVRRGSEVAAAIGTAGPVYRLDARRRGEIKKLVRQAGGEISDRLSTAEATPLSATGKA